MANSKLNLPHPSAKVLTLIAILIALPLIVFVASSQQTQDTRSLAFYDSTPGGTGSRTNCKYWVTDFRVYGYSGYGHYQHAQVKCQDGSMHNLGTTTGIGQTINDWASNVKNVCKDTECKYNDRE